MKVSNKVQEAVTGVSIELNTTELIVLKDKVQFIKREFLSQSKGEKYHSVEELKDQCKEVVNLLEKMIPEQVISLKESSKALFSSNEKEETAEEYVKKEFNLDE